MKIPTWAWLLGAYWFLSGRSASALVDSGGRVTAYVPGVTHDASGIVNYIPGESMESYVARGEASGKPYLLP